MKCSLAFILMTTLPKAKIADIIDRLLLHDVGTLIEKEMNNEDYF